jgi:hypothetical protein
MKLASMIVTLAFAVGALANGTAPAAGEKPATATATTQAPAVAPAMAHGMAHGSKAAPGMAMKKKKAVKGTTAAGEEKKDETTH